MSRKLPARARSDASAADAHGGFGEPEIHPHLPASPSGIWHHSVDHYAALFVFVKAVVKEVSLDAPPLRAAPGVDRLDARLPAGPPSQRIGVAEVVLCVMSEERQKISGSSVTHSHDFGIFRLIDELVDPIYLRRTRESDAAIVDIAPACQRHFRIRLALADGENAIGGQGGEGGVRQVDGGGSGTPRRRLGHHQAGDR